MGIWPKFFPWLKSTLSKHFLKEPKNANLDSGDIKSALYLNIASIKENWEKAQKILNQISKKNIN